MTLDTLRTEFPAAFFESPLVQSAFTHKSFFFENDDNVPHNERLEFLGDAVLNLIVGQTLYQNFPNLDEGFLTKARSNLVNTKILAEKAKTLKIDMEIRLGRSETNENGVWQPRVLASTLEALIGAVFLELGFEAATRFVQRIFEQELASEDFLKTSSSDYKSKLQERFQKLHQKTPSYEILETQGPDHQRTFKVAVKFQDEVLGEGSGSSRKDAEQNAAKRALEILAVSENKGENT